MALASLNSEWSRASFSHSRSSSDTAVAITYSRLASTAAGALAPPDVGERVRGRPTIAAKSVPTATLWSTHFLDSAGPTLAHNLCNTICSRERVGCDSPRPGQPPPGALEAHPSRACCSSLRRLTCRLHGAEPVLDGLHRLPTCLSGWKDVSALPLQQRLPPSSRSQLRLATDYSAYTHRLGHPPTRGFRSPTRWVCWNACAVVRRRTYLQVAGLIISSDIDRAHPVVQRITLGRTRQVVISPAFNFPSASEGAPSCRI